MPLGTSRPTDESDTITTDCAPAWATLPLNGSLEWWGHRLSAVRVFARHLHTIDPCHEVPPTLLWIGSCRPGKPLTVQHYLAQIDPRRPDRAHG